LAWLVQLLGPQDALERLPTLVQGEPYAVVRFENGIYLRGSALDGLPDATGARAKAGEVCRYLESVLQVFVVLVDELRPGNVLAADSGGTPRARNLFAFKNFRVISERGLKGLAATDPNGSTLASNILRLADRDPRVAQAFYIVGNRDIGWHEIYDLIDLMGGVNALVKRGWAKRKELNRLRQTANHHRHRGSRRTKDALPENPPTLSEGANAVRVLLQQWLTERLSKAP